MSQQTVPVERSSWPLQAPVPRREAPLRSAPPVPGGVSKRGSSKSALFGATIATLTVAVILIVQLAISIATSEGAYEASALRLEERDLMRVERVLSQNVDKLSSPQNLAENASNLGMVMNSAPAYLRLSDATIMGALGTTTSDATAVTVPNSLLADMPLVSAEGLLEERESGTAAATTPAAQLQPVAWDGLLPAPTTR